MKILVIGGNRFVGLRFVHLLEKSGAHEIHVLNRRGQVAHTKNVIVYKGDRANLPATHLNREWDLVVDFAGFTRADIESTLKYCTRIGRYVFISTASVYDLEGECREEKFRPDLWTLQTTNSENAEPYQFGKRQAEAVLAQQTQIPAVSVRFPFILGPDDYTHRLEFHIDRIRNGEPIYFPNLEARVSLIQSSDAAALLTKVIAQPQLSGALNLASADAISLKQMVRWIEERAGKKAQLAPTAADETHSPYGVDHDWWLNTEKMKAAGFTASPVTAWLPELIATHFTDFSNTGLH